MLKALYVEDDEDNIDVIKFILKAINCELLIAHDGREALTVAIEEQPSFILMDYHLPGMDGIEATQHLKSNIVTAHIPIIAFTADIYSEQRFKQAGCDFYLSKPIRRTSLLNTIQQVLGASSG